jgi:uncharacterized protein YceH (UPF0502 family)
MEEMQLTLNPVEARVLGALIEKQITTPEYYPLSLNALTNACNQKSNRDPVLQLEEHEVRRALNDLESQSLVRSVGDSRVTKFEHRLQDTFNLYRGETAVLCELLLRGPQTPGELRTRASRMHPFDNLEAVHSALQKLASREPPLVTMLPRQPGTKEARYAHLLGEARPATPAMEPKDVTDSGAAGLAASPASKSDQIAALTQQVEELRSQVSNLQEQFAAFRKQFD